MYTLRPNLSPTLHPRVLVTRLCSILCARPAFCFRPPSLHTSSSGLLLLPSPSSSSLALTGPLRNSLRRVSLTPPSSTLRGVTRFPPGHIKVPEGSWEESGRQECSPGYFQWPVRFGNHRSGDCVESPLTTLYNFSFIKFTSHL